jgi:hypothetical protein
MALVYATRTDLTGYVPAGTTVPAEPEATRLLTSASKQILQATMTAFYDTDTDGYPTDTAVRQAFRDATCAQALWWLINPGLETGTAAQYKSVSIGSVSLTRDTGASAGPLPRMAPQADMELRNAGVLPGSVLSWEGGWP